MPSSKAAFFDQFDCAWRNGRMCLYCSFSPLPSQLNPYSWSWPTSGRIVSRVVSISKRNHINLWSFHRFSTRRFRKIEAEQIVNICLRTAADHGTWVW